MSGHDVVPEGLLMLRVGIGFLCGLLAFTPLWVAWDRLVAEWEAKHRDPVPPQDEALG